MLDALWKLRVLLRYFAPHAWRDWRDEVWRKELDAYACCAGFECGCGGATTRELWRHYMGDDYVDPLGRDGRIVEVEADATVEEVMARIDQHLRDGRGD